MFYVIRPGFQAFILQKTTLFYQEHIGPSADMTAAMLLGVKRATGSFPSDGAWDVWHCHALCQGRNGGEHIQSVVSDLGSHTLTGRRSLF